MKQNQDFGSFRIENGRVFVRDLALIQAVREELRQELPEEKVTLEVIHLASMPQPTAPSYSTLA